MIKLSAIMESKDKYFYHATTCKSLPGIVSRGILPSDSETNWGGDLGKWSEGVDTSKLDKNLFDVDPNVQTAAGEGEEDPRPFIYKGTIPKSAFIEIKNYPS